MNAPAPDTINLDALLPDFLRRTAPDTIEIKCCQCGDPIDDDNSPAHDWGRGAVACDRCDMEAAQLDAMEPRDEPVDEALAHLDRLDRQHGPQHG